MMRTITVLLVLCLAGLGVLLYRLETGSSSANPDSTASEASSSEAIGKFSPLAAPRPAPEVSFADRTGATLALSSLHGHVVLLNLWATWCAPCVQEMPSLARLHARLGDLAIAAISEDRRGAEAVDPFVAKLDIAGLPIYLDPKNDVTHAFGVEGLPTSILIDREGRILGKLEGAAQWDSPDMVKLLSGYLSASHSAS